MSITFETKCYENDWEFILKDNYLEKMISRCGIKFDFKQLIINNVINRNLVTEWAQKKVDLGVIDAFYFTEDTIDEVLNFFELSKEALGKGFIYSISEFTGIYRCKTDYLLHFASDAFLLHNSKKTDWINKCIKNMKSDSRLIIANPVWDKLYKETKDTSFEFIDKEFGISKGCSDQCYLMKVCEFKKPVLKEINPESTKYYPTYGGELFEKRVDSYLRNTDFCRLNYLKTSYIHSNFSKNYFSRKIYYLFSRKLGWTFTLIGRTPGYMKHIFMKLKYELKHWKLTFVKKIK